eukprot:364599-Chlamydomonas_euryale.AAC.19
MATRQLTCALTPRMSSPARRNVTCTTGTGGAPGPITLSQWVTWRSPAAEHTGGHVYVVPRGRQHLAWPPVLPAVSMRQAARECGGNCHRVGGGTRAEGGGRARAAGRLNSPVGPTQRASNQLRASCAALSLPLKQQGLKCQGCSP